MTSVPKTVQWLLLVLASVVIASALEYIQLPAALLIGPMVAAIAFGVAGCVLVLPAWLAPAAFAIFGVMIAASIEPELFGSLMEDWPVLFGASFATLAASALLGWLISRWRIMPGTTAIWGSVPGAASAMVLMADAFGADARLVAFMQYVRVIIVSVAAAFVARLFVDTSGVEHSIDWFPAPDWPAFGLTIAIAAVGSALGVLVRLPSPYFLGPLIIGVALHAGGGVSYQIPPWLLALAYCIIGWSIGLRFSRSVLLHAIRTLPQILVAVVVLMGFCGLIAWWLAYYLEVDALTAYLATSPGGMDTVAIVAAASGTVDISLVMAMQMLRFLIVLISGPPLARWLAGKSPPPTT